MKYRIFIPARSKGSKDFKKIYYLECRPAKDGPVVTRSLHTTDRRVAEKLGSEQFRQLQQEAAGLLPSSSLRAGAERPLPDLLDEYFRDLAARRRSEATLRKYRMMLPKLFKACGWKHLRDVKLQGYNDWRASSDLEPKTHNLYLGQAKGFFGWLVRNDMALTSPLAKAQPVKVVDDDKHRRALTHNELNALISKAPDMRAFIYRVLYFTGLRHNEANCLTVADFRMDGQEPVIRIPASLAKNRRFNIVEVAPAILGELRAYLLTFKNPADCPFFGHIPKIETLKRDLERAGIPFETEQGRFDLHAFRKTLGTHLAMAGEPPQKIQRILRHETLALTMKFYTDASLIKGRESLARLPVPGAKAKVHAPAPCTVKMDFSGLSKALSDTINPKIFTPQTLESEPVSHELTPPDGGLKLVGLERFEL